MPRRAGVIDNAQVAAVFRSYPRGVAAKLRALRRLILDVAALTEGVGEVQETLRWGQPSYLTARPRSGSTIRIYPGTFRYEGNRAIVFDESDEVPVGALRRCIALALTDHLPRGRKA